MNQSEPKQPSPYSPPIVNAVTSNEHSPKAGNTVAVFVVLSLCLMAVLGFPLFIMARPAYDRTILSKIRPGMTKPQVSTIMGTPEYTGTHEWQYSRWGNAGWVEIAFDDSGAVIFINDESVFPP